MILHTPSLVKAKVIHDLPAILEGTVAVAHGAKHTGIAESHNVSMVVFVNVDDKSRMLLHAPSLVKAKVIHDTPEIPEGTVAVAQRGKHTVIAESHDVQEFVARQLR